MVNDEYNLNNEANRLIYIKRTRIFKFLIRIIKNWGKKFSKKIKILKNIFFINLIFGNMSQRIEKYQLTWNKSTNIWFC